MPHQTKPRRQKQSDGKRLDEVGPSSKMLQRHYALLSRDERDFTWLALSEKELGHVIDRCRLSPGLPPGKLLTDEEHFTFWARLILEGNAPSLDR